MGCATRPVRPQLAAALSSETPVRREVGLYNLKRPRSLKIALGERWCAVDRCRRTFRLHDVFPNLSNRSGRTAHPYLCEPGCGNRGIYSTPGFATERGLSVQSCNHTCSDSAQFCVKPSWLSSNSWPGYALSLLVADEKRGRVDELNILPVSFCR